MEPLTIIILFFVSLIASMYGTVVGGTGLLLNPVLVSLGLPPHIAIATIRTSNVGAMVVGTYKFQKKKLIVWKIAIIMSLVSIVGFIIGTFLYFNIPESFFKIIIACISSVGLMVLLFKKDFGIKKRKITKKHVIIGYILIFFVAIYAAMYGPMFATFLSYILVFFFGLSFLKAAGTRKLFTIVRFILTVPIFIFVGKVAWLYVLVMLFARMIGAWIGAHYADIIGNNMIRYAFIVITGIAIVTMFL
jgi:uncharacterized protein